MYSEGLKRKYTLTNLVVFLILELSIAFLLLISISFYWCLNHFGNIGMEEIVFTLNMSVGDEGGGFISDYVKTAFFPFIICFVVELIVADFVFRKAISCKRASILTAVITLTLVVWACCIYVQGDKCLGVSDWLKSTLLQSKLIAEEYVDPSDVKMTFPQNKKNLIFIYVESAETSIQDKNNGGLFDDNYIPEMTELAKKNISFTQSSDKKVLEGAAVAPACGWTMAGILAESSGLPLKMFEYDDSPKGTDNAMSTKEQFMPHITTLGDILQANGYRNYFLLGSKAGFGGRKNYYKQHGDYKIYDYLWAKKTKRIPSKYKKWWGYEDEKLYKFAKESLTQISSDNDPFNFTMLTVDTHHIGGYYCRLCRNEYDEQYGNVWRCASRQLADFIKWCQKQKWYKDTSIVVAGDHCSMDPDFFGTIEYGKHLGETNRKVYECFINSFADSENAEYTGRRFTTLDIFPTTLASMGVKIEGEKLGLGVNLFSSEKTLSEKYGYDYFFRELNKKSLFYNEKLLYP